MEKFAAQILCMTNQCNLNCTYCNWKKDKFYKIDEREISTATENIKSLRASLDDNFPSVRLIEYSGGEVTLYPEILKIMLNTFHDKWFRIVTNGTLINDNIIKMLKAHGSVFVALSLDGNTIESNRTRFNHNITQFNKVLENLKKLLNNNIPVMLLCTINSANISKFHEYVRYLEKEYAQYIEAGMLFMPAHYVFNYDGDNGTPTKEQQLKFTGYIETSNDLLIKNTYEHYANLSYFIDNKKHLHDCHIPDWCLPIHFKGNSIISDGMFTSFGCGMRGKVDFGEFSIHNHDGLLPLVNDNNLLDNVKFLNNENCENYCFVDWYTVDLVLQGVIPLSTAQKWFVLFKDPSIVSYIEQNIIDNNTERISHKTCGTCSTGIDISIDKDSDTINSVSFTGGCQANLEGIAALAVGMKVNDVISRLKRINCQNKGTSCPDQLSQVLSEYISNKNR